MHAHTSSTPWPRVMGFQKKELSVIGTDVSLGQKVTLKQCNIGSKVSVGDKTKLNNCVIMDGVSIGEKYVLSHYAMPRHIDTHVVLSKCDDQLYNPEHGHLQRRSHREQLQSERLRSGARRASASGIKDQVRACVSRIT